MKPVLHVRSSSGFFGAESVLTTLLKHLPIHDIDVYLATIDNYINHNKELYERANEIGIKTISLPCTKRFDYRTLHALFNTYRKHNIGCIHTHDYKSHLYGLIAAKRLGIPLVATLHGWIGNTTHLRFYQRFERVLLHFFDAVVTVSPEMEHRLKSGIFPLQHVRTIANGVDTNRFKPEVNIEYRNIWGWNKHNFIYTTIARLSNEKGHRDLLTSFKLVHNNNPSTRLLIVGSGPELNTLEIMVKDMELDKKVIFTGPCSNIEKILNGIDCYVSPSLTEGMPMVLLEAMASGVPIIATKVGAIPEMLADNSGILVNPRDTHQLANAMQEIIKNWTDAKSMAINARNRCLKLYSAEMQADAYAELYREVCEK